MNIGIIGTGMIAKMMLPEFQRSKDFHCVAICSRREETGRALADQYGIQTVYTSLDAMLADPEVHMVYVASPNNIHFQQAKAALLAGKHVLCEKPFVPTLAEAEELIALAKQKHLLLFEAITTAHHPNYAQVKAWLPQVGQPKIVTCTFCQYSSRYPALLQGKIAPAFDPAHCGGALMDLNLYNIHFVVGLFGAPEKVHYYPNLHSNGVDTSGVLVLEYPGFLCQCIGAKDCAAENSVQISGDGGTLIVTPSGNICQQVELRLRGQAPQTVTLEENPWYYELQSIGRLSSAMNYDACYAALETTRNVVAVLEKARTDGGLSY